MYTTRRWVVADIRMEPSAEHGLSGLSKRIPTKCVDMTHPMPALREVGKLEEERDVLVQETADLEIQVERSARFFIAFVMGAAAAPG